MHTHGAIMVEDSSPPCLLGVQAGLDPLHLLEALVAQGAVSVLSPSQRHPGSVVASGDHG